MSDIFHPIFIPLGLVLALLALVDGILAILAMDGWGPISRYIMLGFWKVWPRRDRPDSRWRGSLGYATTLAVIATWVALTFLGWGTVFLGDARAVVESQTGAPASVVARFYTAGFLITTLGTGDTAPGSDGWRLVSLLPAVQGLVLITLAVSYPLAIVTAVLDKRGLASRISTTGADVAELMERGWSGQDYKDLQDFLAEVNADLTRFSEKQLAYPVVQCYLASDRRMALLPALLNVHDLVVVLETGVAPHQRPKPIVLAALRLSLERHIELLDHRLADENAHVPPPEVPDLQARGLQVTDPDAVRRRFAETDERRAHLVRHMAATGWRWRPSHPQARAHSVSPTAD